MFCHDLAICVMAMPDDVFGVGFMGFVVDYVLVLRVQPREARGNIPQNGKFVNFFKGGFMNFIGFLYKLYLHLFAICGSVAMYAVMCLWAANGGIKLPFMGEILSLIMKFVAIGI